MTRGASPLREIRVALDNELEERFGAFDIESNDEDDERLASLSWEAENVEDIHDVLDFLARNDWDADEFFIRYEINLLSAGLGADRVSAKVIRALGTRIAKIVSGNGVSSSVFLYDGQYFVVSTDAVSFFRDYSSAAAFARR